MKKSVLLMLAVCAAVAPSARAADAHVESFETSLSGWLSTNENGNSGSWSWTNGYARLRFAASGAPFDLTIASLYATSNASGGRFSGDYHAVGAPVVGFDFYCENAAPPLVYIALTNSLGRINRDILPDEGSIASQVWFRVIVPFDAGAWFPATNLPAVLPDVQTLAIAFRKPVPPNQVHHIRLDNVFCRPCIRRSRSVCPGARRSSCGGRFGRERCIGRSARRMYSARGSRTAYSPPRTRRRSSRLASRPARISGASAPPFSRRSEIARAGFFASIRQRMLSIRRSS